MEINVKGDFYEALSMNREIEFIYKEKNYALVFHQDGWCLVNRVENLSDYYPTNEELLNHIKFDGKSIDELFEENAITIDTIY